MKSNIVSKKEILLLCVLFSSVFYGQSSLLSEESQISSSKSALPAIPDGSLLLATTGSVKVFPNASIKLKNEITNLGDGANFTVESDGNLIQGNDDAVNSGNIISKREFKIGSARGQYNYVGTPVLFATGESFKTIFPGSTNTAVLYHNQSNNTFSTSSGANIPGRGLAVKEPPVTTVLTAGKSTAQFTGVPQNGTVIFPVANNNTAVNTLGYNLVGNPYPSNIDLQELYNINGGKTSVPQITSLNISPTFYFWDNNVNDVFVQQGSGYKGQAYAIYNVLTGNNGTGTAAAGSLDGINKGIKKPTNIVKVGQGFMTRSLLSAYNFKFNNSIRTSEATPVDFLGKGSAVQDDRYWLQMKAPSGIASTIAVVYYAAGNNLFGHEDSRSMGGSDAVYSLVEGEKIAIDGRSSFENTDVIPLGTQYFVSGNYTLGIDVAEGIFANNQAIYLKDRQTGVITNLSQENYSFAVNAGESTGRFEIIYQPNPILATDGAVKEDLLIYRDGSDFVVKSQSKPITTLEVYDTAGRLIFSVKPNDLQVTVPADQLINGVYLLKIDQGGKMTTKKVIR